MVQVRSIEESARRYEEGCIKAFLEGAKNENWIRSILPAAGERLNEVRTVINSLQGYGDPVRHKILRDIVGLK